MPRSRNIRLTPIQCDTLWSIEEAGDEDLWTLWITVQDSYRTMPPEQFRAEFVDGLLGLSRLGYVRLVRGSHRPAESGAELTQEELQGLWVGDMREVGDGVVVEITDAGNEALGEPGGAPSA